MMIPHNVHLTQAHMDKFAHALRNNADAVLQFRHEHLMGQYPIGLTKMQHNRIQKAYQVGKGLRMTFKNTHVRKMVKGGFLPFLIPILAGLASGALSAAGAWGTNKLLNKIEGHGMPNGTSGQGFTPVVATRGVHDNLLAGIGSLGLAAGAYGLKKFIDYKKGRAVGGTTNFGMIDGDGMSMPQTRGGTAVYGGFGQKKRPGRPPKVGARLPPMPSPLVNTMAMGYGAKKKQPNGSGLYQFGQIPRR